MRRKHCLKSVKDPVLKKTKHRFSDSKYRQNMQYLYGLLANNFETKSTKDSLLNTVLVNIDQMESEIKRLSNGNAFENQKKELSKLYKLEEYIWKNRKNLDEWWHKMENVLTKLMEHGVNADLVLENFPKILDENGPLCVSELVKDETKDNQSNEISVDQRKDLQEHCISGTFPNSPDEFYTFADESPEKCFESDYLLNNPVWTD